MAWMVAEGLLRLPKALWHLGLETLSMQSYLDEHAASVEALIPEFACLPLECGWSEASRMQLVWEQPRQSRIHSTVLSLASCSTHLDEQAAVVQAPSLSIHVAAAQVQPEGLGTPPGHLDLILDTCSTQ